jgi:hypothetical protein
MKIEVDQLAEEAVAVVMVVIVMEALPKTGNGMEKEKKR